MLWAEGVKRFLGTGLVVLFGCGGFLSRFFIGNGTVHVRISIGLALRHNRPGMNIINVDNNN